VILRELSNTVRSGFIDVNLIEILKMPYFQALRILEIEKPMAGFDIIKFLTLPTRSGTCVGGENEGTAGAS